MKKVKIWECKIIVDEDAELPNEFDWPPRKAATKAIEDAGVKVLGCSSGWGGTLTKGEKMAFEESLEEPYRETYFAGLMDTSEEIEH